MLDDMDSVGLDNFDDEEDEVGATHEVANNGVSGKVGE